MSLRAQAFVLAVVASAAACAHSPDGSRTSQTTTTGASFTLPGTSGSGEGQGGVDGFTASSPELADPKHPANRVATAACERKQECDEIGANKTHATPQACLATSRRRAHEALDGLSCENGLAPTALDACVNAVRIAECATVDSIVTIDACSARRLCAR